MCPDWRGGRRNTAGAVPGLTWPDAMTPWLRPGRSWNWWGTGGAFWPEPEPADVRDRLQAHERTGRPLGSEAFVAELESTLHRPLIPRRPGRKAEQARAAEGADTVGRSITTAGVAV